MRQQITEREVAKQSIRGWREAQRKIAELRDEIAEAHRSIETILGEPLRGRSFKVKAAIIKGYIGELERAIVNLDGER
jgi:cellobiose-specific phosphotransferase system component IIA